MQRYLIFERNWNNWNNFFRKRGKKESHEQFLARKRGGKGDAENYYVTQISRKTQKDFKRTRIERMTQIERIFFVKNLRI